MKQAVTLLLVLVLAACGQEGPDPTAGPGLPTQPQDAPLPGERTEIEATVRVEPNGCVTLDVGQDRHPWAIWPPGAREDDTRVVLPSGDEVGDGDRLLVRGALAEADVLPQWSTPDSLFRAQGTFCGAGERGVILVDDVTVAD